MELVQESVIQLVLVKGSAQESVLELVQRMVQETASREELLQELVVLELASSCNDQHHKCQGADPREDFPTSR